MPTVQVNGLSMYYEIHGEGSPLILITGFGSEVTEYNAIVRPLAKHRKVVIFDNRGAGRTDRPDSPFSISTMADDAAGLMTALGIERADVLGISMGGRIALVLTLRYPAKVNRLVLASTAARRPHLSRLWPISYLFSLIPVFRGHYRQPMYAFRRQLMASQDFDVTGELGKISTPTLIMHGRRDPIINYALAQEMHAGIPGSHMITFRGGHVFMFLKEREEFLRDLREFLDDGQANSSAAG